MAKAFFVLLLPSLLVIVLQAGPEGPKGPPGGPKDYINIDGPPYSGQAGPHGIPAQKDDINIYGPHTPGPVPTIEGQMYHVLVSNARDVVDVDTDFMWIDNLNGVYVQVYGFTADPYKLKVLQTRAIDKYDEPEWDETFIFDDNKEGNAAYTKFKFKLYDTDFIDVFLGETQPFLVEEIKECDEWYSEEMTVYKDDNPSGSVFVSISKDCSELSGEG
eukprot:31438_1